MRRPALLLIALSCWPLLTWGCSEDDGATPSASVGGTNVGGGPFDGGVNDAAGGDGGEGATRPDAGMIPVRLGVTANPVSDDNGVSNSSDVLLAELTTFATGVRVVVVEVAWDKLDPNDLSALASRIDVYSERNLDVVLSLLAVDRYATHLPSSLSGLAWDHPNVAVEMNALLDALGVALGSTLTAVVLNRGTDVYLAANPTAATAHMAFLNQSLTRLAAAVPNAQRGVGVRFVSGDPSTLQQSLVDLGDLAVFEYMPGVGEAMIPADTSPARDLDQMIEQASDRPIVLQAVGFTTATGLASTPMDQQLQFDAFFAAVDSRREAFPIVNVFQLHDLVAQACSDFATAQGIQPTDPQALYVCESGLRDSQDLPKDAWYSLLAATARFAQP
jgi:hypothetical protein